jgi:SAM-dependent methyltransferase
VSAVAWTDAHASSGGLPEPETVLRSRCGKVISLPSARWWSEPAEEEASVLDLAIGPALDLGCGPGRHSAALSRRGIRAIGVDSSSAAVTAARARGAEVLHRSVFDPLPEEGRWASALLLDGNVGIGGDPHRLFRRARALLRIGGRLLVEVEGRGVAIERLHVRVELPGGASEWFPWARVGVDGLGELGDGADLALEGLWTEGGRWFARLDAR